MSSVRATATATAKCNYGFAYIRLRELNVSYFMQSSVQQSQEIRPITSSYENDVTVDLTHSVYENMASYSQRKKLLRPVNIAATELNTELETGRFSSLSVAAT